MKIHHHLALVGVAAALMLASLPALAADPTGVWLTQDGDAHIKFASCGQAFCGTVVWLRDPLDPDTKKPILDKNNPDQGKRKRPVLGITIGLSFKAAEGGKYVGRFYNSDDGQTYNGNVVRSGPNTLQVEGCLGALCQTQTWTKIGS
jgi:uncharacterized protein (DUF2147 family)